MTSTTKRPRARSAAHRTYAGPGTVRLADEIARPDRDPAADLDVVVQRWHVQAAVLAELAGGAGAAAALTGVAKTEIDTAVKSVDRADVDAALAAAAPVSRRGKPAARSAVLGNGAHGGAAN